MSFLPAEDALSDSDCVPVYFFMATYYLILFIIDFRFVNL